jgi:hypothetical protein
MTSALETFQTVTLLQERVTAILSVIDTTNVSILFPSYYKNLQQFGSHIVYRKVVINFRADQVSIVV